MTSSNIMNTICGWGGCMTDDNQTYINTIRAGTTVLNERVVWEKTGVLVLEAELMRQQIGSTKTEPLTSI